MYQLKVNNKFDFKIDKAGDRLLINDNAIQADIKQINPSSWHIIQQLQSHNVEVVNFEPAAKTATIRVNNSIYTITAKDQFDVLLEKMGLSGLATTKISELKAPMPGLVLKVFVEADIAVQKGDSLFILEAMKMENIIKSPADGIVKSIKVTPGDKVEKGQILLQFT
jgi:biotin carboxyl carrier protein